MQSRIPSDAASDGLDRDTTQRLLDAEGSLSRLGGDQTLLAEIASVFVRTVPRLMTSVVEAVTANDLKRAFHQAHSLTGAVAAFEAPDVLRAVAELEKHAKNADAAATAAGLQVARTLVSGLLDELSVLARAGAASQPNG
jgi:HPt (histidine-containing phosphotransfer) domain-containing protein